MFSFRKTTFYLTLGLLTASLFATPLLGQQFYGKQIHQNVGAETVSESSDLSEIRHLLTDQSKSEEQRIREAIAYIDRQTLAAADPGNGNSSNAAVAVPRGVQPVMPQNLQSQMQSFHDPFAEMERMRQMMDQAMSQAFQQRSFGASALSSMGSIGSMGSSTMPEVEMEDKGDSIEVRLSMPGGQTNDVKVNVQGQSLSISGSTESSVEETDASGQVIRREQRSGSFSRVLPLPAPVDADKMTTEKEDDTLVISLPKVK